jgi:hypothetical protein
MQPIRQALVLALVAQALALAGGAPSAQDDHPPGEQHHEPDHDPAARVVPYEKSFFRPDPAYQETWDAAEQERIYGGKRPVRTQRPLLELGRELFREGPFQPGRSFLFGDRNQLYPHLFVYGDWRTAVGYNAALDSEGLQFGQLATRLNLDIDLKLTATERIHAFVQPLERNADLTRIEFGEDNGDGDDEELSVDGNLDALFFEGDLGALVRGSGGTVSNFDLPFAFGLMPLLFQNGVWVEDAFTGVALTLPARNCRALNISNYDVTVFAGLDKVDSGAIAKGKGDDSDPTIVGVTGFLEALQGYFELGYGYTFGEADVTDDDVDYHNLTAAFSRRYGAWLSNSLRAILNLGQDADTNSADGLLLLIENSLITRNPYGFLPYFNLFAGFGHPQSLARAGGAGGVLKNTGINFEADALSGFPALDATGHDAFGAAVGLELLMDFDQANPARRSQLVLELAAQHPHGEDADDVGGNAGNEVALGVRYQRPLSNALILRTDATVGSLEEGEDYAAVRVEFRWKF